jgi:hypothetical protein
LFPACIDDIDIPTGDASIFQLNAISGECAMNSALSAATSAAKAAANRPCFDNWQYV